MLPWKFASEGGGEDRVAKNPYGGNYRRARAGAFKRSGGRCQFCGHKDATDGHHWAENYPDGDEVTSNDITALCSKCHRIATSQRRSRAADDDDYYEVKNRPRRRRSARDDDFYEVEDWDDEGWGW